MSTNLRCVLLLATVLTPIAALTAHAAPKKKAEPAKSDPGPAIVGKLSEFAPPGNFMGEGWFVMPGKIVEDFENPPRELAKEVNESKLAMRPNIPKSMGDWRYSAPKPSDGAIFPDAAIASMLVFESPDLAQKAIERIRDEGPYKGQLKPLDGIGDFAMENTDGSSRYVRRGSVLLWTRSSSGPMDIHKRLSDVFLAELDKKTEPMTKPKGKKSVRKKEPKKKPST